MEITKLFFHTWYGSLILMGFCSIVMTMACDIFEASTDYIGRNLSEGVKGATLNAIGSSMPELLITVFFLVFALHENLGRDLGASIGGNTGSAIFNVIVIPMLVIWVVLASCTAGVKITKKVILRDGFFLIGAEILLLVLLSSNYITHWHGWILTGFYFIYLGYTLLSMKNNNNSEKDVKETAADSWFRKFQFKSPKGRTSRSWILLFFSTGIIAVACAGLVESCKGIADTMKINPLFIALILVAAISSVPDTIISIRDAKKGNHDDALSNVFGSNIFDITISIGFPLGLFLAITGQKINFIEASQTLIDIRIMLLIITVIAMAVYYFSKEMKFGHVLILGIFYGLFILYSIGAADYLAGGDSWFVTPARIFINFLRQPGGIGEILQNIANAITGGW